MAYLCRYPEHVEPLQAGLQECSRADSFPRNVDELPLLDSFIKESTRTTNSDAITCRRKALVPYTFSDGSYLNKGDWACVPQRAMMQDNSRYMYTDAHRFDGFRRQPRLANLGILKCRLSRPVLRLTGDKACLDSHLGRLGVQDAGSGSTEI
ncbi:hypothetical protein TgHK011_007589 [Trichoderma gracile]|nr:hypothetical protein TgHK011_007589 [Trichoderma gracile]